MLVQKKKPETDKEYSHIDLYWNGTLIGYIIQNKSKYRQVNENWNFCSKHVSLKYDFDRTKQLLIDKVTKFCKENGI